MNTKLRLTLWALLCAVAVAQAETPNTIPHQGRVAVDNSNYDGNGGFKFLLFEDNDTNHSNGGETALWTNNDNTSVPMTEPASSVTLSVNRGLYSVSLGDTSIMTALPSTIAPDSGSKLYLRVWFDGGTGTFQQFSPDLEISPVAMALAVPGNAMGFHTLALGKNAVAFGNQTLAGGDFSTTFGHLTFADSAFEIALGRFNTSYTPVSTTGWNSADRLLVIGNGTSILTRADILSIWKDGRMEYNGDIDVTGSVTASNAFKYATPKEYKLQIPASTFKQFQGGAEIEQGYISFTSGTIGTEATAPVNLPDGAVITSVVFGYYDNDGTNDLFVFPGKLRRRNFTSTTVQDVADFNFSSGGQSGSMQYSTQTTLTNATVNDNYQYFLEMFLAVDNYSSNLRFYGVQITYTLDSVSN